MRICRWPILWALFVTLAVTGCADSDGGLVPGGTMEPVAVDETTPPGDGTTTPPGETEVPPGEVTPDPEDVPEGDGTLAIFTIAPDKGSASGMEQVEIQGDGFMGGLLVLFGESLAQDVFVLDEHRLVAITPPRLPGLVDVQLHHPDTGQSAVLEAGYLFFNPVTIIEVDPPTGHVLGGEPITIIGSGFVPGTNLLIGGRAAIQVQVVDDSTILAVTPDAPGPATVDVHVSNELGVGSMTKAFTYFESPEVQAVAPAVGLVDGGLPVEVKGVGFVEPLMVTLGGVPLEQVEVISSTSLMGLTPAVDASGSVDVMVSTSYGADYGHDAFTYIEDLDPGDVLEILSVTPPSGPSSGGNVVTIVAKGLTDTVETSVTFGDQAAVVKGVDPEAHLLLVEAPMGDVGIVDVVVTNSNGTDAREAGYTYEKFIKIYEAAPNFGPVDGGTSITIEGVGFEPGAQVRIGALPAANVQVIDEETITAVTPPGSPGLTNVTVLQGSLKDTLIGGFAYQTDMDLWVIEPAQGSQAGGTFIDVIGSGFPGDATVLVGGSPATHVKVESPTKITARTPPGTLGTVDVTVLSQSKGSVALPWSFTYYDPESAYGGTWGNEVDGEVNVTVLSGADGSPMSDVFVMLWTDPSTPYQGYTNLMGQITFSGPELLGEQMVSASKEGFASQSVIEYNATNITLYMTPTSMSAGAPPPGQPPPIFNGQVVNASKYVPIPWGNCASQPAAPGTLCDPCVTNEDCLGLNCSEIPGNGSFCTNHCVNNNDCPTGFFCYPLNGVPEPQCVPGAGTVTAYCDFTKPHIFAKDYLPPPGQKVEEDFSFSMPVPVGEFAVFCWGGIEDDLGTFTPYALGLKRHVFALPGEEFNEDIVLNHPLNSVVPIRLDDPPNNPNGPNFNYLFAHLDLGSDGTLEFLDHPFDFGTGDVSLPRAPKVLSGDLYDASFTFLGGAFSFTEDNLPISITLHQGITKPLDDTFFVWEASGWNPKSTGVTKNVNALWALGAGEVLGVGSDGLIIRSIATAWAQQESNVSAHLKGVHALPSGEAFAVGVGGTVTHYDGVVWEAQATPTGNALEGVWAAAPDDVFAVGYYQVLHYDGVSWTSMGGNTSKNLRGVYGFAPDDVWAVGHYGQIVHYDGSAWTNVVSGTTQSLRAVWGSGPDDVFIVGEGATILHWDGVEMQPMAVDAQVTFEAVWGAAGDDVIAVGSRGAIYRYDGSQWIDESPPHFDATFLAVAGADGQAVVTGTHELLLGPMLEVPENISPPDLGTMGTDYEISWTVKEGPDPHFSWVILEVPGMFGPVPEWTMINDYYVTDILLPDFPNIDGTPGIAPGTKYLTVMRAYKEGFDIDNYSNMDFNQLRWRSWATDKVTFTKL